ncbi:hypothetical protein Rsub_11099 [Raphidocelis subcapitata]|uniref:Uncharacterized protein n=1 Tax=Raphidocelis subcapitata TaxID=307507 RepID=A0A2V0PF35_9CHLO|nr:hypothetical protein Rsub_11099 [Raphidocelis subcapitata]|eukprot:GBF98454.1 hypothetical protein Rsub_11099 [Raphidocelis subcapitata]
MLPAQRLSGSRCGGGAASAAAAAAAAGSSRAAAAAVSSAALAQPRPAARRGACAAAFATQQAPAPMLARRLSGAAACTSGRAAPTAAAAPAAPRRAAPRRRPSVAAAAKRGRKPAAPSDEPGDAPGDDMADDILYHGEGRDGDDDGGEAEGPEVEAFDAFTSDDDDADLAASAAASGLGLEGGEDEEGEGEGEEGEGEGGWDAALTNFDEAQDERDLAPTPEQLERAEQLRITRADTPEVADELEVIDAAPAEVAARSDEDRLAALSADDAARLRGGGAGYTSFQMEGCDLLIAEAEGGRYDLADSFVFDVKSDLFVRTVASGPLPDTPALYQVIPWSEQGPSDVLKQKPGINRVLKLYFVGVASPAPQYRVDMGTLYCFDAGTRLMTRPEVVTVGDDIRDPVLRITPEGITIEDSAAAPPLWALAAEPYWHQPTPDEDELGYDPALHSPEALRRAYEEFAFKGRARAPAPAPAGAAQAGAGAAAAAAGNGGGGEAAGEVEFGGIEDGAENDDGYYEMPDVPAVDMM